MSLICVWDDLCKLEQVRIVRGVKEWNSAQNEPSAEPLIDETFWSSMSEVESVHDHRWSKEFIIDHSLIIDDKILQSVFNHRWARGLID